MNDISSIERFYDTRAWQYFKHTVHVDMTAPRRHFANAVKAGGLVVDAGCGSGLDSRWFLNEGFTCYSYDASERMAVLARRFLGMPHQVYCHRHDALALSQPADGIWASASLIFLSDEGLAVALRTFQRNLRPGGVLYASFKHGSGWREEGERAFRDLLPTDAPLLEQLSGMTLVDVHTEEDAQGRGNRWSGFMLRK